MNDLEVRPNHVYGPKPPPESPFTQRDLEMLLVASWGILAMVSAYAVVITSWWLDLRRLHG